MRALLLACAALVAAGCAAPETRPPAAGLAATGIPRAFDLSGRVAVRHDDQAFSGNLRWEHLPGRDELWILTPLGQGVAHIVREPGGARVKIQDQPEQWAIDVEALTERVLGWRLPLAGLEHWVLGVSAPDTPARIELDADGRISRIAQDGWTIDYLRRSEEFGVNLPTALTLRRTGLEVRLSVHEWNLAAGAPP